MVFEHLPPPQHCTLLYFLDNLTVQWGAQDHYEIVRKVGRGKYSEASQSTRQEVQVLIPEVSGL